MCQVSKQLHLHVVHWNFDTGLPIWSKWPVHVTSTFQCSLLSFFISFYNPLDSWVRWNQSMSSEQHPGQFVLKSKHFFLSLGFTLKQKHKAFKVGNIHQNELHCSQALTCTGPPSPSVAPVPSSDIHLGLSWEVSQFLNFLHVMMLWRSQSATPTTVQTSLPSSWRVHLQGSWSDPTQVWCVANQKWTQMTPPEPSFQITPTTIG